MTRDPHLMARIVDWTIEENILLYGNFGLTSHCNLRCEFCFWGQERLSSPGLLDPRLFYATLEEMKDMGVFEIELTGGEPTLHPHLADFISFATDLRFLITVTTNGFRVGDAIIRAMTEGLVGLVRVSVHGAKPETHDGLVGKKGAWQRGVSFIKTLVENGIPVVACFVANKRNWRELREARALFGDMGAGFQVAAELFNPWGLKQVEDLRLTRQEMRELVRMDPKSPPVGFHNCGAFRNMVYVDYDGTVYPCTTLPLPLGRLGEHSLREIWAGLGQGEARLRRELAEARAKSRYKGFNYFCPSLSWAWNRSLKGLDPYLREIVDVFLEENQ